MANAITGFRIVFSVALLFFPALSLGFFAFYIAAGISDAIDGAVARKTKTVSEFGSKLDTTADIVFVAACLLKLLPVIRIPTEFYIWITIIAVIKALNIAVGFIRQKEFVSVHSSLNKVAGGLFFIFPLTLAFVNLSYGVAFVCMVATVAAVDEGYRVQSGSADSRQV